jgi:3-dehydroquinate synthase
MRSIDQIFNIPFRYPVCVTEDVFHPDNAALANVMRPAISGSCKRALFVIDSGVDASHPKLQQQIERYCRAHADVLHLPCQPIVLPGGERVKNEPEHLAIIHRSINDAKICRHSFVIAIGGGALLDVAGYAAATAHRGIRLIRLPTTVLAQNDSGVGVKNGINFFGKKNFLGTFAPPFAVINDWNFLHTLEQRDWIAGISEAVKVALIKDAAFFKFLQQHAAKLVDRDMPTMQHLIHRCAELHLQHIAGGGDPFESGTSRPLDFGHWAAHKLEQMTSFNLRHGEAVAIGIALDVTYSSLIGSLSPNDAETIRRLLLELDLPVFHHAMRQTELLLQGLEEFREHLGGQLTITMLRGIGEGYEVHEIDREKMLQAAAVLAGNSASTAAA